MVFLGAPLPLPRLSDPPIDAELERENATPFLRIERLRVRLGAEAFTYDVVTRLALDAVAIAAHFERDGRTHVMLCSAIRPPLYWRTRDARRTTLWEIPAGMVEPGESPRVAAARELHEEVGARVEPDALAPLGPPMHLAPGMIAELHTYFHVAIDPVALEPPPGDASPLERHATLAAVPLDEALALCASGEITDLKSEIVLRRLKEALA